jgi:hypothetical protein
MLLGCFQIKAQETKVDIYDLVKKLVCDSTGYSNIGDWDVSRTQKIPIAWKENRIIMSDDTSINFYMTGTVNISVRGKTFKQETVPVKWNIMLKGPRMGYSSFSIVSSPSKEMPIRYTVDSFFAGKPFKARLLRSCDKKELTGYYYYELKIPKKDIAYIKFSWISVNGNTAFRIDCYDAGSNYAVKLNCPQ